jgi:aromatic ring-cleaving dioxygenase
MIKAIDPAKIENYHAHIYYNAETRKVAGQLRTIIENNFTVEMGRWRDEPVGPHPRSMYQVEFSKTRFSRLVPWLMLNRRGLDHPRASQHRRRVRGSCNARTVARQQLKLRLNFLHNLPKR